MKLLPQGELFSDNHKSPFLVFCENHRGLNLSDKDIETKNKLETTDIQIAERIVGFMNELDEIYTQFLKGFIKNAPSAMTLMNKAMWACKGAVDFYCHSYAGLLNFEDITRERDYLAEKIDSWIKYYSYLLNQADRADEKISSPDIRKGELPPVIQFLLKEGLLDDTPVNGKYPKKGDKKDSDIIKYIFDNSAYDDSLTAELYLQYIQTNCKSTTIQDYIRRRKKEAR